MKKTIRATVFFYLLFIFTYILQAQNAEGNFRSVQSGVWSNSSTWQTKVAGVWINATSFPGINDIISVQNGHTVTLGDDMPVKDIHLNTAGVLACSAYTLNVYGTLQAYTGAASVADTDAIYTNSNAPVIGNIICSGGRLKFVGDSRNITLSGAWGTSGLTTSAVVEFALNAGQTATLNTGFKASSIIISSGTVNMASFRLAPDNGNSGQGDLTIASGARLIAAGSGASNPVLSRTVTTIAGTLNVYGTIRLNGISPHFEFAAIHFFAGSTLEMGGASQNFINSTFAGADTCRSFYNLVLSGSGNKTLIADISIGGTLSMQGTASLALNGHTLSYEAGATLEYKGNAAQQTGSNPSEWPVVNGPDNIKMNNNNGLTLGTARTINGILNLCNGILFTTATNLLTLASTASVANVSDSSFISGPIKKIGNTAFVFPVGKAVTGYHAIAISAPASTNEAFTAEYIRTGAYVLGSAVAATVQAIDSCAYWMLNHNDGTSSVDITIYGNARSGCGATGGSDFFTGNGAALNTLKLLHFNGTLWENAASGNTTVTGTSPDIALTANGVFNFGAFAFGSTGNNPLPVKLLSFTAQPNNSGALLTWATATEFNNEVFEIERSMDGLKFVKIGAIKGKGNSFNTVKYSFIDENETEATTLYYRLKQIDYSGAYEYSNIQTVNISNKGRFGIITLSPNPVLQDLNLTYKVPESSNINIQIINLQGKVLYNTSAQANKGFNSLQVNTRNLSPGIYIIQLSSEGMAAEAIRLVKE